MPFDPQGDPIGDRGQRLERRLGERFAGEEGDDPDQAILDDERIAGEGHHAFSFRPCLIAHPGIADHRMGQMGLALLRDAPDLLLADPNSAVPAVQVGVHPRARLKNQDVRSLLERPDASERRAQVVDDRLAAAAESEPQIMPLHQGRAHIGAQPRQPFALGQRG